MYLFCCLILSMSFMPCYGMDQKHCLIIPGQNGLGGQYVQSWGLKNTNCHEVETPNYFPDFGQNRCQKYLDQMVKKLPDGSKYSIHGSSQGTATAVNYAADNPERVDMLILESVLGSGNSAIYHTVKKMVYPGIENIPGAYYILPYLAKIPFPCYRPSGQQALFSIKKIPNTMPVVIVHSYNDPQLSIDDARALYYALREQGNKRAYFIDLTSYDHVDLLNIDDNKNEIDVIKNLQDSTRKPQILSFPKYQFDHTQFKECYEKFIKKEELIQKISLGMKSLFTLFLTACLGKWVLPYVVSYK